MSENHAKNAQNSPIKEDNISQLTGKVWDDKLTLGLGSQGAGLSGATHFSRGDHMCPHWGMF